MKISAPQIVAIAVMIVIVIAVAIWCAVDRGPSADDQSIQSAPQKFDTSGGQDMRPRWNTQGGAE